MGDRDSDSDAQTDPQPRLWPSRFHFTLRQFLCAILLLGVIFAVWGGMLRTKVTFRPAETNDVLDPGGSGTYFGLYDNRATMKNVVVVQGVFGRRTSLRAVLYLVEAGQVRVATQLNLGRSSNVIGDFAWESMNILLALGDLEGPEGHATQMGCAGQTSGTGAVGLPSHHISRMYFSTPSGILPVGKEVVLHAEGDTPPIVSSDQSVQMFAKQNMGNYLVIAGTID